MLLDKVIKMMHETGKIRQSRYEKSARSGLSEVEASRLSEYRSKWETPSIVAPVVLTTTLLLVAALSIVVVTLSIWGMLSGMGPLQVVLCVFNGMLLSLPVLISLWIALGGQTWIIRVPLATFCLLALLGIYLATIKILEGSIPGEAILVLAGVALAVSAAIQIPAWIVRLWYGVSISRAGSGSIASKQFTIKQLLITTTILAFLVPLLQWLATFKWFRGSGPPLDEICGFCGVFIVVLVLLTLLSVLLVFVPKLRVASLCVLLVGLAAIPIVVVPSINYVMGLEFSFADSYLMDTAVHINVFAFSLSNAVTVIVVLSMYYALGFRLRTQQG